LRRILSIVALAVVAAAACGSNEAPANDDALPLDAVLIDLFGTADVEAYRAQIRTEANELVVTCMQAAGFEYKLAPELPMNPTETQLESADFLLKNGFGIISTFRAWLEGTDIEAQQQDPNRDYLTTLSGAEINQFFVALDGVPAEPGQLQEDGGCSAQAADQTYVAWRAFSAALPNYPSIGEERDTHPDWLDARTQWRECMVAAGYDYAEPIAIASDVRTRMQEGIVEVYPDGTVPLEFDGERWVLHPDVIPLLDEWQAFERSAASAHVMCTAEVQDEFDAVEREVQQGFVNRNRATIDSLLDSLS